MMYNVTLADRKFTAIGKPDKIEYIAYTDNYGNSIISKVDGGWVDVVVLPKTTMPYLHIRMYKPIPLQTDAVATVVGGQLLKYLAGKTTDTEGSNINGILIEYPYVKEWYPSASTYPHYDKYDEIITTSYRHLKMLLYGINCCSNYRIAVTSKPPKIGYVYGSLRVGSQFINRLVIVNWAGMSTDITMITWVDNVKASARVKEIIYMLFGGYEVPAIERVEDVPATVYIHRTGYSFAAYEIIDNNTLMVPATYSYIRETSAIMARNPSDGVLYGVYIFSSKARRILEDVLQERWQAAQLYYIAIRSLLDKYAFLHSSLVPGTLQFDDAGVVKRGSIIEFRRLKLSIWLDGLNATFTTPRELKRPVAGYRIVGRANYNIDTRQSGAGMYHLKLWVKYEKPIPPIIAYRLSKLLARIPKIHIDEYSTFGENLTYSISLGDITIQDKNYNDIRNRIAVRYDIEVEYPRDKLDKHTISMIAYGIMSEIGEKRTMKALQKTLRSLLTLIKRAHGMGVS